MTPLPFPDKQVMIVDDEFGIRDALTMLLEDEGYAVSSASNGQEALQQLREDPARPLPCVILLDLMMPIMDGWQFKAVQEQDPRLSPIPVIVISADGSVRQKAAALHASEYLQKPIELEKLLDIVGRCCNI